MSYHSSCMLFLLPTQRDSTITSILRSAGIYPRPATGTKRFTSSVQYFLLNYQQTRFACIIHSQFSLCMAVTSLHFVFSHVNSIVHCDWKNVTPFTSAIIPFNPDQFGWYLPEIYLRQLVTKCIFYTPPSHLFHVYTLYFATWQFNFVNEQTAKLDS